MSLVISMEDVEGKDINIQVEPEETFESFLSRASSVLGYLVDVSSIAGNNSVSLSDNIYQFLLGIAVPEDDDNQEEEAVEFITEEELATNPDFAQFRLQQEQAQSELQLQQVLEGQQILEIAEHIKVEAHQEQKDENSEQTIDQTVTWVQNGLEEASSTVEEGELSPDSNVNGQIAHLQGSIDLDIVKHQEQEEEETEQKKMENDLLSILNMAAGQDIKTFKIEENEKDNTEGSMSDYSDSDIEFLEEHLEEEEEHFYNEEFNSDDSQVYDVLEQEEKTNKLKDKGVQILSVFNIPKDGAMDRNNVAVIKNNNKYKSLDKKGYNDGRIDKNIKQEPSSDGEKAIERDIAIVGNSSDEDFTDVEFLDETILEEDAIELKKQRDEEAKAVNSMLLDLEDNIDSYTIVKQVDKDEKQVRGLLEKKSLETELKKIKKHSNTDVLGDMGKEFNKVMMNCKSDSKTEAKQDSQVYTREQLLNLLEGSSDSEADKGGSDAWNSDRKRKVDVADGSVVKSGERQSKMGRYGYREEFKSDSIMNREKRRGPEKENMGKKATEQTRFDGDFAKSKSRDPARSGAGEVANSFSKDKKKNFLLDASNIKQEQPSDEDCTPRRDPVKRTDGYTCRLCSGVFDKLQLAITHTMVHKLPDRAIFPCILCQFGFQSYPEVRNHMRREHKEKYKSRAIADLPSSPTGPASPAAEVKQEPMGPLLVKTEPQDECGPSDGESEGELLVLEEWLEDEMEDMLREARERKHLAEKKMEQEEREEEADSEEDIDKDEDWLAEEEVHQETRPEEQRLRLRQGRLPIEKVVQTYSALQCSLCGKQYANAAALAAHACPAKGAGAGGAGSTGRGKKALEGEMHRCALCGQAFHTLRRLLSHRSLHQAELLGMGLRCTECRRDDFSSEAALYEHLNQRHNQLFRCCEPSCTKEFHLRSSLKTHGRVHGKRRLRCDVCLKQFFDTQTFKEHKVTHLKVKPFQCHICLKFLNRRSRLRMHLLAHEARPSENSVLACRHCHMAFRTVEHAQIHILASEECRSSIDPSGEINLQSLIEDSPTGLGTEAVDAAADRVELDLEKLLGEAVSPEREDLRQDDTLRAIAQTLETDLEDIEEGKKEVIAELEAKSKETNETDGMFIDPQISASEVKELVRVLGGNVETEEETTDRNVNRVSEFLNEVTTESQKTAGQEKGDSVNESRDRISLVTSCNVNDSPNLDSSSRNLDCNVREPNLDNSDDNITLEISREEDIRIGGDLNDGTNKNETALSVSVNIDGASEDTRDSLKSETLSETEVEVKRKETKAEEETPKKERKNCEELSEKLSQVVRKFVEPVSVQMVYRCEYCEKVFCQKEALNRHRQQHQGRRLPFQCNVCQQTFATYARVTSHKKAHGFFRDYEESGGEGEEEEEADGRGGPREKSASQISGYEEFPVVKHFLCPSCDKTFLHWTYLQVHRKHKHSSRGQHFTCPLCGEIFSESWMLNHHRRKFHPEALNSRQASSSTNYKCADCGQNYHTRKDLGKHRDECHDDSSLLQLKLKPGPFTCRICSKVYQTKVGLDGHMRIHEGGLYLCDLCGNGFAHQAGLETHHKRVHLRELSFACEQCGRSFFTNAQLVSHQRCHSGEKPFPCLYCPMAFRTTGRRNEHHRVHTGERPYPCDMCGLAFRRSNAMKNHRLIHTGQRPHGCPHPGCGKLFHVRSNLNTHVRQKHCSQFLVLEVQGGVEIRAALEQTLRTLSGAQPGVPESLFLQEERQFPDPPDSIVDLLQAGERQYVVAFQDRGRNPGESGIREHFHDRETAHGVQGRTAGDFQEQEEGLRVPKESGGDFQQKLDGVAGEAGAQYHVEEVSGDDGQIEYQVKYIHQ